MKDPVGVVEEERDGLGRDWWLRKGEELLKN
jgi:hypothetical protein